MLHLSGILKSKRFVSSAAALPVMLFLQVRNGTKSSLFFVKCHIAVHHSAEAYCTDFCKFFAVLIFNVVSHIFVACLNTCPNVLKTVCPNTVFQTVFPFVTAGRNRIIISSIKLLLYELSQAQYRVRFCRFELRF